MNWGYKILTVIVVFIAVMAFMVTIAMKQTNEMMDEQYYVRELKHQDLIDANNNLNQLDEKVSVQNNSGMVEIILPKAAIGNISEASALFIRPSEKSQDRNIPLSPDTNGHQIIPGNLFSRGLYKVRLSWKNAQTPYYTEQSFYYN